MGCLTPGDPTVAYAINYYYETNYREAAEPWHEDEEYGASTSTFVVAPSSTVPTCAATTFTPVSKPSNYNTPQQYAFCSYIVANTSAPNSVGAWSIITTGVLSVTTTFFTSFATADSIFYQIGTAISGTRTYVSSAGNSTVTIGTMLQPGGDGQNNNKLYNASSATAFDDGGWSYNVPSGTPLPGVNPSSAYPTTAIRLYYSDSGYWTEQALSSFQNEAPSSSSQSSFTYQLGTTIQCPPGGSNNNNNAATRSAAGAASAVLLAGAAAAGAALLL